jgi:hypothetical protein
LVLNSAASSHFLNANLIDTASLATTTVGNVTITSAAAITDGNNGDIIVLSPAIKTVTATGSGDTIVGPSTGNATITDTGGSASIHLAGTGNVVNDTIGDTITGYRAGADHLSSSTAVPNLFAPTTAAKLDGHTLTTAQLAGTEAIVFVGTIGGTGSATDIATAANAVFTPAALASETVIFYGQTGADTAIYKWVNTVTPTTTVTAAELTAEVTLIGITATTLTAGDFHS